MIFDIGIKVLIGRIWSNAGNQKKNLKKRRRRIQKMYMSQNR